APHGASGWRMPLLLCHNMIFYMWHALWPVGLSPYYPWPRPFDLSQPAVQVGLIGTIGLIIVLAVSLRLTRSILIGWLIFFVLLIPWLVFIVFPSSIAAVRFLFLARLGLILLIIHRALHGSRGTRVNRWFVSLALTSICFARAVVPRRYLREWTNSDRLMG